MTIGIGDRLPKPPSRRWVRGHREIDHVAHLRPQEGVVPFRSARRLLHANLLISSTFWIIDNADAFKKKGVHTVACVAVNDPFC